MNKRLRIAINISLLVGLAACARPRDVRERFNGHAESINVFEITSEASREIVVRSPYGFGPAADVLRMRQRVTLSPPETHRNLGIYASMLGAFEVRWDGRLIGTNGVIGADGRPAAAGPIDNFFPIPSELAAPGLHEIEIRVAPARTPANWFHGVAIGNPETMVRTRVVSQVVPLSGIALFVVVAAYYAVLAFSSRRRAAAVTFALLCIASALLALAESWRWTVGYTWDYQHVRLSIVTTLTFAVALLVPLFLTLELQLARPVRWAGAFVLLLGGAVAVPASSDARCLLLFWISLLLSAATVAAGIATRGRRAIPGAIAVVILFAALASGGYSFGDNTFFVAFCLVIASLLVSTALEQRREKRQHEEALLRATRLEIQLLHKSIQPHFVMNTLTAVMEWLEEEPAAGVRFLEAFAEELRLFSSIARERIIPIVQELALCRSHLTVMGCRKGMRFHLLADAVDHAAAIPPAIFHTLVENAITHNRYTSDDVRFVLSEEREGGWRRYVFDAPVTESPEPAGGDGTGLRYVKARLEESYPGSWSLHAALVGNHWRTTIEVPA